MAEDTKKCDSLIEFARLIKGQDDSGISVREQLGLFLEEKARERRIPIHGAFELTPLCNLDCKMCYVHLRDNCYEFESILSTEKWKDVIKQAYDLGMRKATLTGGECLTHPGFDEIYLYLRELGVGVTVLSNGVLLNRKRIQFFLENKIELIQISLYGSSEDAYYKVTGQKVFCEVYENLISMREAGLPVQIAITPNRYMFDDMHQLIELAESLDIPYEINCRLISPRENTGRRTEDLTLDQYIEMYSIRAGYHQYQLQRVDPTSLPEENHKGKMCNGLNCGAGYSSFTINYKCEMMPCTSLPEYTVPVKKGMFGEAWEKIHRYAKEYQRPGECEGCIYFSICLHCPAFHKDAPKGHCNPQICERTKKLVETGFYKYHGSQL